ncbi:MAG TPA: DUF5695 domain-containing protein [Verrucomicrobiae bacterium]|jgi:hypothetical protein
MKTIRFPRGWVIWFLLAIQSLPAQVTYTDNFDVSANYLTAGVAGTMWDGVYLGSSSIADATGTDGSPGAVSVANANITAAGTLSVTSINTDWENAADDGFLLFKVITGDFDMSVRVVTPFNSNAYNLPGLMVRAFGAGGAPEPNNAENSFLWARFSNYNIANMLKNNVNGAKTDTGEGVYPNTNYWLRITRAGNNFKFFERGPATAAWTNVASLTRADLAGLPLEAGIEQADFANASLPAQFASFSLTVSNQEALLAPSADTALTALANTNGTAALSWMPGSGTGSVVVLWLGTSATQEQPANGTSYTGNASYGLGSSLPAVNYYVVYSGAGTNVTVTNLAAGTTYYAAAFSYSGLGNSLTYSHAAATGSFSIPASGGGGGNSVTWIDNFNSSVNYLQNGLVGTIWDGVYFGSGEFNNTAGGDASTIQCDANISTSGALTLQTTGTAWEGAGDDGFFLFKVVPGDFSAVVQINTPFNAAGFNTAGLQARAFEPNGNAYNGSENFVSWTRFDEYNYANYLRNNVNGGVTPINPGDYPNGAYWVRIDRVHGTNFLFYQRTNSASPWELKTFPGPVNGTTLTRTDLAGLPLQVGIMHATFAGQLGVSFGNFSINESNATFAAAPSPASNLTIAANADESLSLSWTPGAGSAGSAVAMWAGTNLVKEIPADGFTYTGNASYGLGSALPGAGYSMVSVGTNTSVTVSNIVPGATYYAAAYSYAGTGTNTSYSRTPAMAGLAVPFRGVSSGVVLSNGDVLVTFTSNPGEWYWLQYSDSLSPANWQNIGPLPAIATNLLMTLAHRGGAGVTERFYRIVQMDPEFGTQTGNGVITSLTRTDDATSTEYLSGSLGAVMINYGVNGANWSTAYTSPLSGATASYSNSPDGTVRMAHYQMTSGLNGPLVMESDFAMQQSFFTWTLGFTNLGTTPVIIGDIALQFPMNTAAPQYTSSVFKHSVISGDGSFIFWMRNNSVGPYLLMTPATNTGFEYWDTLGNSGGDGYEAYIHSAVSGPLAEAEFPTVTNSNARWRLPNTTLTLAPGASTNYTVKFQWASDYNGVRQALVNEGKVDVRVVPGMTLPTNLFGEIAFNTIQQINSITPEFPEATQLEHLGTNGSYQLYKVQFSQLGENMLTINYGANQVMYLEFMMTEPPETLFKKRAAFLVSHQQWAGITNWFNGLFADWNENDQVRNSPINYDTISGFVVYEVASDDAGESRPAYMGEKESVYPVQSEVSALDLYITNFVWPPGPTGGMQRKTNESDAYGVYGINDWHELRQANSLSLGRTYDYPHMVDMWYSMYKVAKYNPQITTAWAATNYLQAAWGTALAMYTVANAGPSTPGLMSEVVYPDVLTALHNEGMTSQEAQLRPYWESKVAYYATGNPNLFGSEYGFDSTGFEATEAFAKYALTHAGSDAIMGSANPALFLQESSNFMYTEVTANMFDRGFLETPYYHYGSDFRAGGSDNFCLSYMTQMGGWGLLDYALNYATNFPDFLRLGYGSYLAGWGIMNTGTAASDYGFWYHGTNNDGACGGGYEPQAAFNTWLGQPTHRGPWYYSAEQNLGFCGAVRSAATIVADDPIFGRFCFGGTLATNGSAMNIIPLDGIRRRFHALLAGGTRHVMLDADRFASNQPVMLNSDLSAITMQIESDNPGAHIAPLHLSAASAVSYAIVANAITVASGALPAGQDVIVQLPVAAGANVSPETFSISYN